MNIKVRPEELRNSAETMEKLIEGMKSNLKSATDVMEGTRDSFESNAANELRSKYTELTNKFPTFYNEMTSYVAFLRKTASDYEKLDQEIQNIANQHLES